MGTYSEKRRIRRQESDGEVPGKIRRGRPKRRRLDNIKNDWSEREKSGEEAQDRVQRRRLIRNIDPHIQGGKDAEEEEVCIQELINGAVV